MTNNLKENFEIILSIYFIIFFKLYSLTDSYNRIKNLSKLSLSTMSYSARYCCKVILRFHLQAKPEMIQVQNRQHRKSKVMIWHLYCSYDAGMYSWRTNCIKGKEVYVNLYLNI